MIHYAEYLPNGKYVAKGTAVTKAGIVSNYGGAIHLGVVDPLTQYHNVVRNQPAYLPEKPSVHHVFDYGRLEWVDPRSDDDLWVEVRRNRDQLLAATDWVVLRATDTGTPVPPAWQEYRQKLRDLTDQPDPRAVVWPEKP